MSRLASAALLALAGWLALAAGPARADERILRFDSHVAIQPDGSLEVTEDIRVRVEGNQIRRGIYRDFPTRYRDRHGNRVVVDFTLLDVKRDGSAHPSFTERRANGIRINTGNDDFLPTGIETTFTIRYRTNRQLGYFAGHDELYWNVTGNDWAFPIDAATAEIRLPRALPYGQLQLDAYTGRQGEQGQDAQARTDAPGVATFATTRPLQPGEGFTVAVGFPKGIVPEPTRAQRWGWFFRDNAGVLVGVLGLGALLVFYGLRWSLVGRDPAPGPVFPRYGPPKGFAPGELRMLRKMMHDREAFTADLVDMAVHGALRIHGGEKDEWRLERIAGAPTGALSSGQRALAAKLFKEGPEVELKNTEAARVGGAIAEHAKAAKARMHPRYYLTNGGSLLVGVIGSLVVGAVALGLSRGFGIPALFVLGGVALIAHVAFAWLLRAPTSEGRRLLDEIEGLALYLGVAERDELKSLPAPSDPPPLDAARYEALLPYAMALDVEEAWTRQFTAAVGLAAATAATPSWYVGPPGTQHNFASFGSSIGKSLDAQISSSSTPPGSSSGGGGGGFSGGGGGGGGGGGR